MALGHHLFFAHAHAEAAENTVLVFLPEALLPHIMRGCQILNDFGLRA